MWSTKRKPTPTETGTNASPRCEKKSNAKAQANPSQDKPSTISWDKASPKRSDVHLAGSTLESLARY